MRASFAEKSIVYSPPTWWQLHRGVVIRHVVINIFMVAIILPLLWVLLLSIKSLPDSMRGQLWPRQFDFSHYGYVFEKIDTLPINLFNSIFVTGATVLITTACAVLAGFALVHLKPRGGVFIVAMFLASLYFPTRVVSIITIYEIQSFLDLINSTSGLILPYITLNLAISVLIMRAIFQLVPRAYQRLVGSFTRCEYEKDTAERQKQCDAEDTKRRESNDREGGHRLGNVDFAGQAESELTMP